jgi:hypothetical protein
MSFRATLLSLGCLTVPIAPGGAGPTEPWQFGNLQQGYCVTFLVSPEDAPGVLPDDAQPVRLDAMPDLTPVLARVLADQPEYGAWMPAALCVYRFGRAASGSLQLVAADESSEMIGILGYWARVAPNQPPNGLAVSMIFTNDKWAAKATDTTATPFRLVKASFGKAAHGDEERHVIELGKTKLIWDGHPAGDSARSDAPVERVWVVQGPRGRPVLLRWSLSTTSSRSMVGALVIIGKDKLAKLLRRSPIRFLGPMYQGGSGQLSVVPE